MAEYSIEISGPRDESIIFAPTQTKVRGRWDFQRTAHRDKLDSMKRLAYEVPVIPGKVIALNTSTKQGCIFDPLSTGEGAKILEKINAIAKEFGDPESKAHPREDYKLDANGVKDWLYWMRRKLDNNEAVLVPGSAELPTLAEIAELPGRRLADPFNTSPQTLKAPDDQAPYGLYKYADERPLDPGKGKSKESATA